MTGVDLTPAMIDEARRRAAEEEVENVGFEIGDATALDADDAAFDEWLARGSNGLAAADPIDDLLTEQPPRRRLLPRGATRDRPPPPTALLALPLAPPGIAPLRIGTAPSNRKRPAGEARRFWGYYREESHPNARMAERNPARRAKSCPVESG